MTAENHYIIKRQPDGEYVAVKVPHPHHVDPEPHRSTSSTPIPNSRKDAL